MVKTDRLLSLDVMRGITIAGMILVNNPGTWSHIYAPLRHAEWNGLTPTDLVFPFFMFIMGISTYFSLRKYGFGFSAPAVIKVLRRAILLILIGWALGWLSQAWAGFNNPNKTFLEAINNFANMRYLGVFPRLGICYGVTALLALCFKRKALKWIVGILLASYTVMLLCGNGFCFGNDNIISVVDRAVLGEAHMYTDTVGGETLRFDPEGLLSTLPSIAHCLIGFLCGAMIVTNKDNRVRSYNLLLFGAVFTMAGFLLSYGVPINKKVWSPTFVLTTCGLASLLLGLLIWIIDIKKRNKWCTFFRVFGVNPLFLYVLSTVLAIAFIRISFVANSQEAFKIPLQTIIFENNLVPLCNGDYTLASFCYAILFVLLNWSIGYCLYRKKIYIKL